LLPATEHACFEQHTLGAREGAGISLLNCMYSSGQTESGRQDVFFCLHCAAAAAAAVVSGCRSSTVSNITYSPAARFTVCF
jgi:hypothetical protein